MSASKQGDASPDVPPQVTMLQMISGFWLSRAVSNLCLKAAMPTC